MASISSFGEGTPPRCMLTLMYVGVPALTRLAVAPAGDSSTMRSTKPTVSCTTERGRDKDTRDALNKDGLMTNTRPQKCGWKLTVHKVQFGALHHEVIRFYINEKKSLLVQELQSL